MDDWGAASCSPREEGDDRHDGEAFAAAGEAEAVGAGAADADGVRRDGEEAGEAAPDLCRMRREPCGFRDHDGLAVSDRETAFCGQRARARHEDRPAAAL